MCNIERGEVDERRNWAASCTMVEGTGYLGVGRVALLTVCARSFSSGISKPLNIQPVQGSLIDPVPLSEIVRNPGKVLEVLPQVCPREYSPLPIVLYHPFKVLHQV